MSKGRVGASHFSPDTRAFIQFLHKHGVRAPRTWVPRGRSFSSANLPTAWTINSIDGVDFAEAWQGRLEAVLVSTDEQIPLLYIGLDELIKNKRASGRPKDQDDLSYLTRT